VSAGGERGRMSESFAWGVRASGLAPRIRRCPFGAEQPSRRASERMRAVTLDEFPQVVLTALVARHVDAAPAGLAVRRCPTGKFNATYFVEGGPVPLVLRIAPPDDRSRVLFYEHRMMRQEPALHTLLRERTDVPVPSILAHDFGDAEIERDYLLM